jgi:ATP-dependent DNA ligase
VKGPALGVNSAIQKSGSVDLGSGGRPKPLPREFKPMLASPWTEPPEGADWIFEVKWDRLYTRVVSSLDQLLLAVGLKAA